MDLLPKTPTALLEAFRTLHPTSPRLSWYGPEGERVEFSGRVLENWVAKSANYLVDELDAEPGTIVAVDLPLHWRSLVWLLASWAVGATAVTGGEAAAADVAVDIVATTDPVAAHELHGGTKPGPLVVAVALPALAMRWLGELPPRTLDYCGDVRSHADVFFADDTPATADTAWRHEESALSYGQLLAPAAGVSAQAPQRLLLQARDGWAAVVPAALEAWAAGGSVVLLGAGVEATDALRSSENVTAG
ncbi:hypothetical protein ART_3963 [Arthrobacter sp. PAMC 25486]|uniref:TIGR03089 family protein n=1 Tax=Arthrobacter sp. PAMC 25486 TaxID=1494608 RepID=UPI000535B53E|nr:TIGR03089 family protein [Arthrobacter sp. PAMC 25486]AIY03562.1 hypothetical protein ART_3963 [Arthrobacter sp. PAMC 25486]